MIVENPEIFVISSDDRRWLLSGFAYLFNKFWSKEQWVSVVGCSDNGQNYNQKLPENFAFYNVLTGNSGNQYTDLINGLLRVVECSHVLIMNDDDWILGPVDHDRFATVASWATSHQLFRLELANRRAGSFKTNPVKVNDQVIISQYMPGETGILNFSPSIWQRELLLTMISPGENRWEAQVNGDIMMQRKLPGMVYGLQDPLLNYVSVFQSDHLTTAGLPKNCIDYMRQCGYLSE